VILQIYLNKGKMYFLEITVEQKPKNVYYAEFFSYFCDTTSVTQILLQFSHVEC